LEYIKITFTNLKQEEVDILVALLSDVGFESFEEVDSTLHAYVHATHYSESLLADITFTYIKETIQQQNWNAIWESSFEPVEVFDASGRAFACVRASFHESKAQFQHDIIITPKMSFGTGHHATTFLVMQRMATVNFANKCVFDFGTGTAVLAVLAEKLGAAEVLGIDNDEWSITNATENTESNGCAKIKLLLADTINDVNYADVILANINLNVIAANIIGLKSVAKPGALFLFSGIMQHDDTNMQQLLIANGFTINHKAQKGEWMMYEAQLSH
jgi:ribosomal protein L11 methyltransferase